MEYVDIMPFQHKRTKNADRTPSKAMYWAVAEPKTTFAHRAMFLPLSYYRKLSLARLETLSHL